MKIRPYTLLLTGLMLIFLGIGVWLYYDAHKDALKASFEPKVTLTLVEYPSGTPMANTDILFLSHKSIMCIAAPCPNNSVQLDIRTNAQGKFTVPKSYIQDEMSVSQRIAPKSYTPIAHADRRGETNNQADPARLVMP